VPAVKTAIYIWFRNYLGSDQWSEEILLIQKILLQENNRIHFEKILAQSIEAYKKVKENEVKRKIKESEQFYEFELPQELFFNEHTDEQVKLKNYAYNPCYLTVDRSIPERNFEKWLNANADKILWWWKNGENKQEYFGVRYEYEGNVYTFYPDYLVLLKNKELGIFEVKDKYDRDGKTLTKAKAEALQQLIIDCKRKDLFGGIVIEVNKDWLINSQKEFNWSKCEKNDWGDWRNIEL
jgi:type III restriction enzyme